MGSAQAHSDTTSAVSEDSGDNLSTANAYNANLKPLKARPPEKQILDNAAAMLPAQAILEQFDRAQQYVLKHEVEFTPEQHEKLQVSNVCCVSWAVLLTSKINRGVQTWF